MKGLNFLCEVHCMDVQSQERREQEEGARGLRTGLEGLESHLEKQKKEAIAPQACPDRLAWLFLSARISSCTDSSRPSGVSLQPA